MELTSNRKGSSLEAHLVGGRLLNEILVLQNLMQLFSPYVVVCLNVIIIVAFAILDDRCGAQSQHGRLHPLTHRTEVLILLVAQPEDTKLHALQMSSLCMSRGCASHRHVPSATRYAK